MNILKPEELLASPCVLTIKRIDMADSGIRRYWLEFEELPGRQWFPNETAEVTILQCLAHLPAVGDRVVLRRVSVYNPVSRATGLAVHAALPRQWYDMLNVPMPMFNIAHSEDADAR